MSIAGLKWKVISKLSPSLKSLVILADIIPEMQFTVRRWYNHRWSAPDDMNSSSSPSSSSSSSDDDSEDDTEPRDKEKMVAEIAGLQIASLAGRLASLRSKLPPDAHVFSGSSPKSLLDLVLKDKCVFEPVGRSNS
jgi:hypothetical protein